MLAARLHDLKRWKVSVYVLTRVTRTTEAGLQLTDKQLEDMKKQRRELVASLGGKTVAVYRSYTGKGLLFITSYPSLEAAEKYRTGFWGRAGMNGQRYFAYEMDILSEMPLDS
jgi:hypothetical protein